MTNEKENKPFIPDMVRPFRDERINELRRQALEERIPVMDEVGFSFLTTLLAALRPKRILEIGTAVGLSGAAMLSICPEARLTTVELDEERYERAKETMRELGVADRATCHLGDAGEILRMMDAHYDFVLLDGPKAQYPAYMSELKRMVVPGGVIFIDDVLLFGWVNGKTPVPEKHRLFVRHMREWLDALCADEDFMTDVLDVGNGIALSVRK